MKIYILNGDLEQGPYEKGEIFGLLKSGAFSADAPARWEDEGEWRPLGQVLASGRSTLLSVQQIEIIQQESAIAPPVVHIDLPAPRVEVFVDEPAAAGKGRRNLLLAGVVLLTGSILLLVTRKENEDSRETAASMASVAPAPVMAIPTPRPEVPAKPLASATPILRVESPPKVASNVPRKADKTEEATFVKGSPTPSPMPVAKAPEARQPDVVAEQSGPKTTPQPETGETVTSSAPSRETESPAPIQRDEPKWNAANQPLIDPFQGRDLTSEEFQELLAFRFSSRAVPLIDDDDPSRQLKIHKASFRLDTNLKTNPTVEVVYGIPLNPNGSAGPNADQIIMQGFYPGAMEPPQLKEVNGKWITPEPALFGSSYIGGLGCTQFMLRFYTPREIQGDPEECYFYGGKEWVDLVFRAQKEIMKRHKLKNRKLILVGHSIGGTFIERIAAARPEAVAAAVVLAAPDVSLPAPNSEIAWFLGLNRGDTMRSEYKNLYNELILQKQNVIFNIFPPDFLGHGAEGDYNYHAEGPLMAMARKEFLSQIVERNKTAGRNNVQKWPYIRDRENPLIIMESVSKNVKKIPESRREYLPSREFAECLQSLPVPMQALTLPILPNGKNVKCMVGIPPLGKPQGVVVYLHKPYFTDVGRMIDNIYFLAGKGYVVLAPKLGANRDEIFRAVAQWVKQTPPLSNLSLTYMGWGDTSDAMWQAVVHQEVPSPAALAAVDFKPARPLEEKNLPIGGGVKCPFLFVYNEYKVANVTTSDQAKEALKTIKTVKEYVAKCEKKGLFAKVAVVMADASKRSVSTPQAINFSEDFMTKVIQQRMSKIMLP